MNNFIRDHKILSFVIFLILLAFFSFIIRYVVINHIEKKKSDLENLSDYYFSPKKYSANEYSSVVITDQTMAKIYLIDFINTVDYNTEMGYNLLNEQYRNSKFGSLDNFVAYINDINMSTTLEKYYVEGNKYYIFDSNGNEYIFVVDSVMDYYVYLDSYTVTVE